MPTCWRINTSWGFSTTSHTTLINVGRKIADSTATVQNKGLGIKAQHSSSMVVSTAGTTLRRRLSSSFQRESTGSGLGSRLPLADGTDGSSQAANCQSPRVQRWRRLTSSE